MCLVSTDGRRCPVDYTLEDLEELLDPHLFFWFSRMSRTVRPAAPSAVRLQLPTRDVLAFPMAEIDSVRQQPLPPSGTAERRRGFGHYTELGALAARNTNSSVNTSAVSFQTVNGYLFRPTVFVGAGIGVDLYATQSVLPVFASLRGDLLARGPLRPFYSVDGGYDFNLTGRDGALAGPVTYAGGALWAAGLGLKVLFNNQTGFLVSVGYRVQQTALTHADEARQDIEFQLLALRAGLRFRKLEWQSIGKCQLKVKSQIQKILTFNCVHHHPYRQNSPIIRCISA